MFKRIFAMIKRDLKSGMRDAIILYIVLAPILLAFLLSAFMPAVGGANLQFAVLNSDMALQTHLGAYGKVETFANKDELNARINRTDDIVGFIDSNGHMEIVMEGNETDGMNALAEDLALAYQGFGDVPVNVTVSDIGWRISLIASIGVVSIVLLCTLLGGMLTGLNIVEERQARTMHAMRVSPTSLPEFLIAKSTIGVVIPILQSLLAFVIFGFTNINWGMAVVICIAGSIIGLIVGITLGVTNDDPLTTVGGLKIMMLPMSAAIIGALLLPQKLLPLLYWNPYYWAYKGVMGIIQKTATWGQILLYSGAIIAIAVIIFAFLRTRIKTGLTA